MFDGSAYSFFNNLNDSQKDLFESVNKLIVNVKSYNDNVLIGNFDELYVAGWKKYINKIFDNDIPSIVNEPTFNSDFNVFKQKAIDLDNAERFDDTEIKFIFNFLENYWSTGNRFVLEIESTYYSCTSCQGYFLYLKQLAKNYDKTIEITIKSDKRATTFKELEKIFNF